MKKLLLPLFATMALVSQAWGQYQVCASPNKGYCKWTNCDPIAIEPGANWSKATCEEAYDNCVENGILYTDDKCTVWSGKGNDPNFNNGTPLWCKWASSCHPLKNQTEYDKCKKDGSVFKTVPDAGVGDGKSCQGGTWNGEGKNPNAVVLGCCQWNTGTECWEIFDEIDEDGKTGAQRVENCKSGSNKFWNGVCPAPNDGTCPATPPVNGGTSSAGNSSNPSSSSGGTNPPSSSSIPSSSSAVIIRTNGYAIFPYDISNTTTEDKGAESKSVWGTDVSAYVFPEEGDNHASFKNPTNPHYTDGKLAVDEGVLKLKDVNLGTSPGTNDYYPGAFLQIKAGAKDGKKIEDCTSGFSYWYKGDAHWFILEFDPNVCGSATSDGSNKWGKKITTAASINWKQATIALSDLPLANTWEGANCKASNAKDVKLDKVTQIAWGFDDKQTGTNLMIGDIVCLGSGNYETKSPANSITTSTGYFGGSTSPILSHNNAPVSGLNLTHFARNLQIATSKNATVSMFDIHGKQVFTQKVLSGTTTISLTNQRQGIYYVVAKSGSQKQIVKIILK